MSSHAQIWTSFANDPQLFKECLDYTARQTGFRPELVEKDYQCSVVLHALAPAGDIPPEFAEFNVFDPAVNTLLASQLCATPYQPFEEKVLGASTGRLVQDRGRCRTHIPLLGP